MSSNRNYRSNGGGGGGGGGGYRQHSSKVTVQMTQERAHVSLENKSISISFSTFSILPIDLG